MTVSKEDMTSDCLFVYGTLTRGFDHPMARLLSANADFLGEARCRGRLYLIKHYPGLVLSDDADDIVHGELCRMRAPNELLREFDMYEACGEGFVQPTEYFRTMRLTWFMARCTACAPRTSCCASSTCTRPAARVLHRRPNICGGCSP